MTAATKIPPRPSASHAWVDGVGWTNDLATLLAAAERLAPEGWTVSLRTDPYGVVVYPLRYGWSAGWCPDRGPGLDSVWGKGATAVEALVDLHNNAYRLPRAQR